MEFRSSHKADNLSLDDDKKLDPSSYDNDPVTIKELSIVSSTVLYPKNSRSYVLRVLPVIDGIQG